MIIQIQILPVLNVIGCIKYNTAWSFVNFKFSERIFRMGKKKPIVIVISESASKSALKIANDYNNK